MKKVILITLACMIITSLSGCFSWSGGITASNVPIKNRHYTIIGGSDGTDNTWYLFSFIPLSTSCSTKEAEQRCINKLYGDALIDATVDTHYYNYFFILSRNTITVEGKVIRFDDN